MSARDLLKHSNGLGLEFTWEGWTESEAMMVARMLFEQVDKQIRGVIGNEAPSVFIESELATLKKRRGADLKGHSPIFILLPLPRQLENN
jgi:hypothetical protein